MDWNEKLAVGIDTIDNQHKELIKRVNALLEACRQGKGKAEIGVVVKFLDDYVITHFSEEEKYMRESDYPGYARHKTEHLEFIATFSELKKEIDRYGPALDLVVKTNRMVVQWLINHISKVDTALGMFLKAKA